MGDAKGGAMTGKRRETWGLIVALVVFGGMVGSRAWAQETVDVMVLDNDTVQVMLLNFAPGEVSEQHANPEAELGIILEGELTVITPEGREVLRPGAVKFLAPLTPHEARNEGATPVKMWALLLKKCK
jgi:quercetin dioxygenase-like cupin family protein